ncbi:MULTISPECIES: hypothetical protein [unclassified Virgibacillus]|uniref:hypothetical protein n=1 Tax=unclassified Virgibacillus TaxID=2620237 RepID=UPI0024DEAA86|nr:hypothetical protein [Virgibacillus sp. LDC-1]
MKYFIRSFSIGLFTAGLILLAVFYFFDNPEKAAQNMSVDEMISEMKDKGYRVLTESEYITLSVNGDTSKQAVKPDSGENSKKDNDSQSTKEDNSDSTDTNTAKDDKDQSNPVEETKKEEVKTYTVKIESGMPSSKIGDMLESNKIIDDASKFNQYLEKENYSTRVQQGEFKVNSGMSFFEIAEAITR